MDPDAQRQAASEFTRHPGETWSSYVARRASLFGREREASEVFRLLVAEHGPDADEDALACAAHDALLVAVDERG